MEIEVDDYIRTNDGRIFRVYKMDNKNPDYTLYSNEFTRPINYKIAKHSKNIIDLIEVGDIVNGERILDITGDYIHTNETNHNKFYLAKHIKTILTKEQYQANCYTVERKKEC